MLADRFGTRIITQESRRKGRSSHYQCLCGSEENVGDWATESVVLVDKTVIILSVATSGLSIRKVSTRHYFRGNPEVGVSTSEWSMEPLWQEHQTGIFMCSVWNPTAKGEQQKQPCVYRLCCCVQPPGFY